ncbi:MAG TPA: transcriptional repressor LexA [Oleiagrimonas sp.]|nr:transcriptional repressor LexA [Oleiagrimonas sp.]
MTLPPGQQRVLDFLRNYVRRHGLAPSYRDIQHGLGFASPNAVRRHLVALEHKGLVALPRRTARGIRIVESDDHETTSALLLPLIGKVAAGAPILVEAQVEKHLKLDPALFTPQPDYLLRVDGDSMIEAGILDGDLIAVKQTAMAHNGQTVVARVDDAVTVKIFERTHAGIRLLPRNRHYAPIEVDARLPFAIEGLYCGLVRRA